MKTLLLILSIVFGVLCFAGGIYVFYTDGSANAGYAVVPMVLCLACMSCYRSTRHKEH